MIVGVGLIVTANEAGVPGQALNVGVTVTVPTMVPGALLFVLAGAIHEAICPLPLTAKPICALVFDHPKVAPFGFETNVGGNRYPRANNNWIKWPHHGDRIYIRKDL